jgi:flagellar hook-basal body complex protein FliE
MNPISALGMFPGMPGVRGAGPVGNDAAAGMGGIGGPIPDRELSQLKSLVPPSQDFDGALQGMSPVGPKSLASIGAGGDSFGDSIKGLVGDVVDKQAASGRTVRGLISGDGVSLHQAMIAMEEASVSFQLMVEVRNKLLESYQELMRMQV